MIIFPNAKINLGLRVLEKRADGYHNIDSVFYPVKWEDALEIVENNNAGNKKIEFSQSGIIPEGNSEDNLVVKAYRALDNVVDLPPVKIHLHKTIPTGAGLGGGSSDAAFTLRGLNELFELNLEENILLKIASTLGSDCAFFVRNRPVSVSGTGTVFEPTELKLNGYQLLIIWPGIHSNTAEAYKNITPNKTDLRCAAICKTPPENWREILGNDFESSVFSRYPAVGKMKQLLYDSGAIYAAMSGSGSAVYGIFKTGIPDIQLPKDFLFKKTEL